MREQNNQSEKNNVTPQQVKELIKPRKLDTSLIREVEALCGELSSCGQLRRMDGSNVEHDEDILF